MAVVATGFFDGVHLGHRKLIETLLKCAEKRSERSLIVSFWPHPRIALGHDSLHLRLLTSQQEKTAMLRQLGVDDVEVLPFNREFACMSTREYLSMLKERFDATMVVLGYDNRVGSDLPDPQQTARIALELGLEVEISSEFNLPGYGAVSSTLIRNAVREGRVEDAAAMLGYNYSLSGTVVHGKQLGRTIGFPTANMQPGESQKLLPAAGAYLTRVNTVSGEYFGMTNVGPIIETHIFDFASDIYGSEIKVGFLRRIRDEKHFSGVEELKSQLQIDEMSAKKIIFEIR